MKRFALLIVLALVAMLIATSCQRGGRRRAEYGYVAAGEVNLRDRVAPVFNKTGSVENGERVEILERSKNGRFARVRSPRDEEGWMEQRYLTTQGIFEQFQKMSSDNANWPVQGRATTRASLNIHAEPDRDSAHLYQMKEGEKVELLKRATSERAIIASLPAGATPVQPPPPVIEDWWLVRDSARHTGWVLARIVDLEVPIEVAQYAEGQRIIACFVLNQVEDNGRNVPQYLMLLSEPKDGSSADFNQVRVFTWNAKRDRYETAYRERNVSGMLPVTTSFQQFENEGNLPVFTFSFKDPKDPGGTTRPVTYKMNGVLVKKVVPPDQAPKTAAVQPTPAKRPPATSQPQSQP
jgi:hypothetical protein